MDLNQGEGKKIFFLYPHNIIRDEMLDLLILAGYETSTVMDEQKAKKLLKKFPDSIMFINVDEGMKEPEWEAYIKSIQEESETNSSKLGVLSNNQDKVLMQKYLVDLSLPCGYIQLKPVLQESTRSIISALEVNEARGRRKFIRADCHDDASATLNFKWASGMCNGKILDISSAGITTKMEKYDNLSPNLVLKGIQLRLRGGLVLADMICAGNRKDDKRIFIYLFDPKMPHETKLAVCRYIKICLQKYIDGVRVPQ
jgi:hypothetical protein